jgi:hypothetical protein
MPKFLTIYFVYLMYNCTELNKSTGETKAFMVL